MVLFPLLIALSAFLSVSCSEEIPKAREELVQKLYDGRDHIRIEGALALGEGANRLECAELVRASEGASVPVRRAIATALGMAKAPESVDYLGTFLNDRDDSVRAAATRALATRKEDKARGYVLSAYASGGLETRAAIAALGPAVLEEAVREESDLLVDRYSRARAEDGCCPWKADHAEGCGVCPLQVRVEGLRMLGVHGSAQARAELALRLRDPSPSVAVAAAEALALAEAHEHKDDLKEALNSPRPEVAAAAGLALVDLGEKDLLDKLAKLVPLTPPDVALEILRLIDFSSPGVSDEGLKPLCQLANTSPDLKLAQEALQASKGRCILTPLRESSLEAPTLDELRLAALEVDLKKGELKGTGGSKAGAGVLPEGASGSDSGADSVSVSDSGSGSSSGSGSGSGSGSDSSTSNSKAASKTDTRDTKSDSKSASEAPAATAGFFASKPDPQALAAQQKAEALARQAQFAIRLKVFAQSRQHDPQTLQVARNLLEHENAHLAAAAAEYIGVVGDSEDAQRLLYLAEKERQLLVRHRLLEARRQHEQRIMRQPRLGDSKELMGMMPALEEIAEEIEGNALNRLLKQREARSTGQLLEHREGAGELVRAAGVGAALLGADASKLGARLLDDEAESLRQAAVAVALALQDEHEEFLKSLASDEDRAVRLSLGMGLALRADPEGQRILEELLNSEEDPSSRLLEVRYLAPFIPEAKKSLARAALRNDAAASEALWHLSSLDQEPGKELQEVAESHLYAEGGNLPLSALELLDRGKDEDVLQRLAMGTVHPDGAVRHAALQLFIRRNICPSTAQALVHDFERKVRLRAREALAACPEMQQEK